MGGNLPGQSETLCGQPIQVAACGSHSAGIRTSLISQKPVLNAVVRVGAAVAQEWPVAAHLFDPCSLAAELLESDAIYRRDPATVRDGVAALDRFPRIQLLLAVFLFLGRMPTNGGRVEQNVGALEGG